jgi:uncharacterized protein (TIGR00369 family)
MIPDEPVRGRTPPPWYRALSGIDRARAFSRGLLPWPPLNRLLGVRLTHVAAGTVTGAMPASDALNSNGQLVFIPLMVAVLEAASGTAISSGFDLVPLRFAFDPFRPAWPRPGNLIARARVVVSGDLYVFAEVDVEDPDGRYVGRGSLQSEVRRVEPAPPPAPETMRPVEEPVYETPDPYLRSFHASPFAELAEREDGLTTQRKLAEGLLTMPVLSLFGMIMHDLSEGRAVVSMPASEWFCLLENDVSCAAIAALADLSAWAAVTTLYRLGQSLVMLDNSVRFLRPVHADGRRLRADTVVSEVAPNRFVAATNVRDPDGQLVAMYTGSIMRIDADRRTRRQRKESRRVLATLLFTDIVDSTGHAERLGDTAWHTLLEQHKLAVRREVSRYNGTEVNTTGDGFFLRFDSPDRAIQAARAARLVTAPLGTMIRAGIHTGECELEGDQLAGVAVHIASRIQAAAEPGEILVSSTVKDLAVGSNVRFTDKGKKSLKGVPDPWRVYAVVD